VDVTCPPSPELWRGRMLKSVPEIATGMPPPAASRGAADIRLMITMNRRRVHRRSRPFDLAH
jgi:hypothetical protein